MTTLSPLRIAVLGAGRIGSAFAFQFLGLRIPIAKSNGIAGRVRNSTTLRPLSEKMPNPNRRGRPGAEIPPSSQALIHGDSHSGSVMATQTDTRVIDPEFALVGPIGFDLGAFLGNLLIGYFSQPGHATEAEPRTKVANWLIEQIPIFWEQFRQRFLALRQSDANGDAFAPDMLLDPQSRAALLAEQQRFVDGPYPDMVGFAAAKMILRILGFAHVIDFEEIADPARRAKRERATLEFARTMLTRPERFSTIGALVLAARKHAADTRSACAG